MKAIVIHNSAGRIVSIARVERGATGTPEFDVGARPRRGQSALELEITGDLAQKPLGALHNEYGVDRKAKRLTKRSKK